jgi:ubiquinone/menaquinone biosynthesis C-methylase UbiE
VKEALPGQPAGPRKRPGWLLDELASAGRENLDADHVARYDRKENSDGDAEVAVLIQLGLGPKSTVIDLGAGTGQFCLAAAPHCRRVVAADVSPLMLDTLASRVEEEHLDNIEVVRGGFLTYDHTGLPADFVYSRYALHHLPDFWKGVALQRMSEMLRPGGVLRIWDVVYHFDPDEAGRYVEAWCATGSDNPAGEWSRAEFEEHIRDENSTFTWLLEPMIERAGFEIRDAEYSTDGMFAKYVAVAA